MPLPRQSLYWDVLLPFYAWELSHQLSRSRSNKPCTWSHPWVLQAEPVTPGSQNTTHPSVSALINWVCCVFTCPWAPWGQRPCLIHICIPPAKPLCSINVWWTTEGKNVHHQKIAHQSLAHQRRQEMLSSNVASQCQYLTLPWFSLKHWKFGRAHRGGRKGTLFVKQKIRVWDAKLRYANVYFFFFGRRN